MLTPIIRIETLRRSGDISDFRKLACSAVRSSHSPSRSPISTLNRREKLYHLTTKGRALLASITQGWMNKVLLIVAAVFAAGFVAGGVDLIANQPDPFVGFHRGQPTRSTCSTSGLRRNLPCGPPAAGRAAGVCCRFATLAYIGAQRPTRGLDVLE